MALIWWTINYPNEREESRKNLLEPASQVEKIVFCTGNHLANFSISFVFSLHVEHLFAFKHCCSFNGNINEEIMHFLNQSIRIHYIFPLFMQKNKKKHLHHSILFIKLVFKQILEGGWWKLYTQNCCGMLLSRT